MSYAVAVDIGGTFTDLVAYDHTAQKVIYTKSPTTYHNLVEGILDCFKKAGVKAGAVHVSFDGLDRAPLGDGPDFVKSLPIDHALSLGVDMSDSGCDDEARGARSDRRILPDGHLDMLGARFVGTLAREIRGHSCALALMRRTLRRERQEQALVRCDAVESADTVLRAHSPLRLPARPSDGESRPMTWSSGTAPVTRAFR